MEGTSISATPAMRWIPPRSTSPTITVMSAPGTSMGTSTPKLVRAASTKVRATVLDWAMFPVPRNAAHMPKNANDMATTRPALEPLNARTM